MPEPTQSNSGSYASRYEHWEREYKRSVGQAHVFYSSGKTLQGDHALDYANTARRIAISEREEWAKAIIREGRAILTQRIIFPDDSPLAKQAAAAAALQELTTYLDEVFASLKDSPE